MKIECGVIGTKIKVSIAGRSSLLLCEVLIDATEVASGGTQGAPWGSGLISVLNEENTFDLYVGAAMAMSGTQSNAGSVSLIHTSWRAGCQTNYFSGRGTPQISSQIFDQDEYRFVMTTKGFASQIQWGTIPPSTLCGGGGAHGTGRASYQKIRDSECYDGTESQL
jgi:hypothetical protein